MQIARLTAKHTLLSAAVASCLWMLAYPNPAVAQATEQQQSWDIPAGPLDQALRRAMTQGRLTISYAPDLVSGKTTRGVQGAHAPAEALRRLLEGTGVTVDALNGTTFVLRAQEAPVRRPEPTSTAPAATTQGSTAPEEVQELEKMTVTGTRIRGAQLASPLVTISQEEMRLTGQHDLGAVVRAMPANFSGGQNPGVLVGTGGGSANANITGSSTLNLRGLGPDATITLLNGQRLPYDGFSQATDVAAIPIAAIDRFEVLLDGASAVYGSDAVGGVGNIILRRDYDGADLTARYGQATDGGHERTQISMVVGNTWASGSLMVAAESISSGTVLAPQRDYLRYIENGDGLTIYPRISQEGVLVSGYQMLGASVELALDAFITNRSMHRRILSSATIRSDSDTDTSIHGVSPSIRFSLPGDWTLRIHAFSGVDEARGEHTLYAVTGGPPLTTAAVKYENRAEAAGVEVEGTAFSLPAGDARVSFGGGWRRAHYETGNLTTGVMSVSRSHSSRNLFAEVNLPLVSDTQNIPFVRRLSLSAAARHEDYDEIGNTTTPKIGASWTVVPSLDVRASVGRSFKAPRISEQYQAGGVQLRTAASVGIVGVPSNATVLTTSGGNPDLRPERATTKTAGLVFRPPLLPGASFELGYYDIDFTDRIVAPNQTPLFLEFMNNPAYSRFVVRDPTRDVQQQAIDSALTFSNVTGAAYDPDSVIALFENKFVNAAIQRVRGIDLNGRYSVPVQSGLWTFNVAGAWITDANRQIVEGTTPFDTAGVVWHPPKFKGSASTSWSQDGLTFSAIAYHLGGVRNTAVVPNQEGSSMTTFDVVFDYAADPDVFGGFGFNLSINNLFNRSPPFMMALQPFHPRFDSTNYSALGRVVNLSITKRF